jgi:hypothetical protein
MNQDYKSIQKYIRQAQLERQIYLANIMANGIVAIYNFTRRIGRNIIITGNAIFKGAQNRAPRNKGIFTFDA